MISKHVYRAYLIGSPDVELSLTGGQLTLDDGTAPHVQGDITIAWPGHWKLEPDDGTVHGGLVWVRDDAVLTALDPKLTPRVRIEADGEYPSFSQHREFDLGIRSRNPDQVQREVTLELASDESLLEDYRAPADDPTPLTLATSLRAVVNYVLGKAIPGAALDSVPGVDVDVTPLWGATNYLLNPHAATNVTNWTATNASLVWGSGMGAGGVQGYAQINNSTQTNFLVYLQSATTSAAAVKSVREGDAIVGSIELRSPNVDVQARLRLVWWGEQGNPIGYTDTAFTLLTSSFTRFTVKGAAPRGASKVSMLAHFNAPATGRSAHADAGILTDGPFDPGFFFGGTADTPQYDYAFTDAANASTSTRTPLVDAATPDAFVWQAGQSALDFLHPLVQAHGLRLVCDETRTWTLRDENYTADGSLNIRYGVNMIDGDDLIDRDSGLWFDAAVTIYKWTEGGSERTRIDYFELTPNPTKVERFEKNTPYPGPGFSEYAVRRAQGRGRELTVSAVARWTERPEQPITTTLDGAPIQTGKTSRVTFDLSPGPTRDRVTVTTRTTDTDPAAWLLQNPDTAWVNADPDETWLEAANA